MIGAVVFGGIDWSWFGKPERTWWEIVLGRATAATVFALFFRKKGLGKAVVAERTRAGTGIGTSERNGRTGSLC